MKFGTFPDFEFDFVACQYNFNSSFRLLQTLDNMRNVLKSINMLDFRF